MNISKLIFLFLKDFRINTMYQSAILKRPTRMNPVTWIKHLKESRILQDFYFILYFGFVFGSQKVKQQFIPIALLSNGKPLSSFKVL